jgi:hypothetical protein
MGLGCLLATLVCINFAASEDKLQVNLSAYQMNRVVLTAGSTYAGGSILLDSADGVKILFGSPMTDLGITLISPSGIDYPLGGVDRDGIHSFAFPDPSDPNLMGVNYVYNIESPEVGTWFYTIEPTQAPLQDLPVFVHTYSESPVRAAVLGGGFDYTLGQEMTLATFVMNGMSQLTGYSVQGSVSLDQAGASPTAIVFADDASPGDALADDGISTARFTPQASGTYWFRGQIEGVLDNGEPFVRSLVSSFRVLNPQAGFVGGFLDRGIDLDNDGYFDALGIALPVDVVVAGEYNLHVTLQTANGAILTESTLLQLAAGSGEIEVHFSATDIRALGEDGPYSIVNALLEVVTESDAFRVDRLEALGQTDAWSLDQFQRDPIEVSGVLSSYGVDSDNNGLFDRLMVEAGLNLIRTNYYQWSGRLLDSQGTELGFVAGAGYLNAGESSIVLTFNGRSIGENGIDGPYLLSNLIVFDSYNSVVSNRVGETVAFLASQFEGYVAPDTEPPTLSLTVTPEMLWPVNHKMVEIFVEVQVQDNMDASPDVWLESVTSSDGENELGDGHHSPDIEITEDGKLFLRAERSGLDEARIYTITYKAKDDVGNVATVTATVTVPHDSDL